MINDINYKKNSDKDIKPDLGPQNLFDFVEQWKIKQ